MPKIPSSILLEPPQSILSSYGKQPSAAVFLFSASSSSSLHLNLKIRRFSRDQSILSSNLPSRARLIHQQTSNFFASIRHCANSSHRITSPENQKLPRPSISNWVFASN